jgi:hypothetical protein
MKMYLCDDGCHLLENEDNTDACPHCAVEARIDQVIETARHVRLAYNADQDRHVSRDLATAMNVLSSLLDELDWEQQDALTQPTTTVEAKEVEK